MSGIEGKGWTRRGFLKVGGAAGAAAAIGGRSHVLTALANNEEKDAKPGYRSAYSICDMCFNKCGVIARVDRSGAVRKLDPNPKFAKSRGMLCARGNAGIGQLYDPDRLKYPMLRKGERGSGQWQRLTWDQALDLAAERLEKIGKTYTRCGVLFMAGTDMQSSFVHRFAGVFGSFNVISHESNCLVSVNRAFVDTFGEVPNPDLLHCKYVILAGANRFESLVTPDTMDLVTAMHQGCKLVVLDPRFTKTAALAHEYHPIRPGTDMAFFLAVAHVIVEEDLYDRKFAEERLNGLDQLKAHVKQYTPEWAEKECEIQATDIRRIARELAEAAPAAMVYPGRRSSDYEDSTQIRRSFAIVNALLGNFDQKGGLTVAQPIPLKGVPYDAPWYDENPKDRIEAGRSTMMFEEEGSFKHARDAVIEGKPYPVKGFFTYKTNPMATGANRRKTIEMIRKLDFMVSVDIVLSDTAWMADLVLPAPTYLERQDPISPVQGVTAGACIVTRDPVVPPLYESKPVFWIMKELANRLDLGEFFNFTMEEYRKKQLSALPEAQAALEKDGVYYIPGKLYGIYEGKPLKTSSKKIEIYSQRYKQAGLDPLPVYRRPAEVPAERFRLVVGRNAYITQGSSTNNGLLSELVPENTLWVHPVPARKMGLSEGDSVEVSSKAGKGTLKVRITEETRPDTVYMDSGFGLLSKGLSKVYGKGASIVEILEDRNDEISGNMAMNETLVSVRKV
ncbi:MAG: twin-arginine translocation signal domain-containing protein [Desulfobacteraceae bacterium]|nr:MAG: twin-arginine translocation signal domain-containing protein [Desulfobacteraceae bacterium]